MKQKNKKNLNLGQCLLVIAVFVTVFGVFLAFTNKNTTNKAVDNTSQEEVNIPDNMEQLSKTINEKLGNYILYNYVNITDTGVDILDSSEKRLNLISYLIELSGKNSTTDDLNYNYIATSKFKEKYIEVYGNDNNYDDDIELGYAFKDTLSKKYIQWSSNKTPIAIERIFTASSVDYDKDSLEYTINGTYVEKQLGAETATGAFIITYKDKYIKGITLMEDVK